MLKYIWQKLFPPKYEEYELTPKGKMFLQYLQNKNNGIEQQTIEAYEDVILSIYSSIIKEK